MGWRKGSAREILGQIKRRNKEDCDVVQPLELDFSSLSSKGKGTELGELGEDTVETPKQNSLVQASRAE